MSVDQLLMVDDDGGLVCEWVDEGEPAGGASLDALVDDWVMSASLEDRLHPYLDDSLWVLKGFSEMIIRVIEHFEEDDLHRDALLEIYKLGRDYVSTLLVRLNDVDVGEA